MRKSFGLLPIVFFCVFNIQCEKEKNAEIDHSECDSISYADTLKIDDLKQIEFPCIKQTGNYHFTNEKDFLDTMEYHRIDNYPDINFCKNDLIGLNYDINICYKTKISEIKIGFNNIDNAYSISFFILRKLTHNSINEGCWKYEPIINDSIEIRQCICDSIYLNCNWFIIPKVKTKPLEISCYFL